jgi:HEAT repeat protein
MHQNRHLPGPIFRGRGWFTLAIALWGLALIAAEPVPLDPVEDVRQALQYPAQDPKERDRNLAKHIEALRSVNDMRRALLLYEWPSDQDQKRMVELRHRSRLTKRFKQEVRQILQQGTTSRRLAVMTMLAETGTDTRTSEDRIGIGRDFGTDLAELIKQENPPSIREAAARCLGQVFPDPDVAAPALRGLLGSRLVTERRAAAKGLGSLVRVVSQLAIDLGGIGGEIPRSHVVQTGRAVVPAASRALTDADREVRLRGAEILELAATALIKQVPDPTTTEESVDAQAFPKARVELQPLAQALNDQVASVIPTLKDADINVRLAANRALEAMANARLHLLGRVTGGLWIANRGATNKPLDDLLKELPRAARPLAEEVSHKDVRVRLASLYVLETLEAEAAPAAEAVVKALQDDNPFVRWAAVRTLGKMAPHAADKAVPGLAKLIHDDYGDVRIATLAALERFGPAAKSAVPALKDAVNRSEAATRVWVIRALAAVGKEANPATPELMTALTAPEAEVRTAAAKALGKLGPLSPQTEEALLKALHDPDAEVRLAASGALLVVR